MPLVISCIWEPLHWLFMLGHLNDHAHLMCLTLHTWVIHVGTPWCPHVSNTPLQCLLKLVCSNTLMHLIRLTFPTWIVQVSTSLNSLVCLMHPTYHTLAIHEDKYRWHCASHASDNCYMWSSSRDTITPLRNFCIQNALRGWFMSTCLIHLMYLTPSTWVGSSQHTMIPLLFFGVWNILNKMFKLSHPNVLVYLMCLITLIRVS